MYGLILTLHILICLALVIVVLVQMAKTGGLGGLLGSGGGSDALFSAPSGNLFMKKLTMGLAIAFFSTTLLLTILHTRRNTRSVLQRVPMQQGQ